VIDIMKGIGILLVVLGHAIQKNISDYQLNPLYNVIYSFHMPLFFIIAGYLLHKTLKGNRLNWVKNKAIYFVIPHVFFNILYYLMSFTGLTIFENLTAQYSFLNWIKESLIYTGGEWFLWVLFIVLVLMLIVDWANRRFSEFTFWVIAFSIVGILLFLPDTEKDYFRLFELEWYFLFTLIGYLVAKYSIFANKYVVLLFIGSILYFVLMYWTDWKGGWPDAPPRNLYYYLEAGNPIFYVERLAQALLGISVVIFVSKGISKIKSVSFVFAWLGRISLGVYLFHMFFSSLGFGSGWLLVGTSFIFSLALGIILTFLCSKIPFIKRIWLKGTFAREARPEPVPNLL